MRKLLSTLLFVLLLAGCGSSGPEWDEPMWSLQGYWAPVNEAPVRMIYFGPDSMKTYIPTGGRKSCHIVQSFKIKRKTESNIYYEGADLPLRYKREGDKIKILHRTKYESEWYLFDEPKVSPLSLSVCD